MKSPLLPASMALLVLAASCSSEQAPATTSSADLACQAAVELALPLLPENHLGDVQLIRSGQSGPAVSCAVTGTQASVMVDATTHCAGGAEAVRACTQLDGVEAMNGAQLYP